MRWGEGRWDGRYRLISMMGMRCCVCRGVWRVGAQCWWVWTVAPFARGTGGRPVHGRRHPQRCTEDAVCGPMMSCQSHKWFVDSQSMRTARFSFKMCAR